MLTKTQFKSLCGAAVIGCLTALSTPAMATNDAMLELIDIMQKKGTLTKEEAELLRSAARADEEQIAAVKEEAKKEVEAATKDLPKVDLKEGFKLSTQDGNFEWKIGGRIMADAAFYDEGDGPDLGTDTEFRRARLEMEAKLWKVWGFKFQYDFTDGGDDGIRDAFINYTGFRNTKLTVGNFKEPFSLEELTSSKYITFMERALPNVFAPGRALGVGFNTHFSDMFTVAGGVFGEAVDDRANSTGVDSGIGVAGRLTFSPFHGDGRVLHLGTAVAWRQPNDDESIRFRERFESHVTDTRIVDTNFGAGDLDDVDDFIRYGFEAAAVYDRFSLQGEYLKTDVNFNSSALRSDPEFDGFYVYGSVFLTPDSRAYKFKNGAFDKVSPKGVVGKGGIGAWELGLRYSSLDLTDEDVFGGDIDNLTVGINWYATKNIRFMANYVAVLDSDDNTFGGGAFANAEPEVFQLRSQVFW